MDARFGFDGGRHTRFMEGLDASGANSRDWLVTLRLLKSYKLRVRDLSDEGFVATLPDISPEGG